MQRLFLVRRLIREVYGSEPRNDASITDNYVNALINEGIGLAVKQNYKDALQLDGVAYINSSFYTTFKNLTVTKDADFKYKIELPDLPVGIGKNEGVDTLQFTNADGKVSKQSIPLSISQEGISENRRKIPNRITHYAEGKHIYANTSLILTQYKGKVRMISGGGTNLTDELNVPIDYLNIIEAYVIPILTRKRNAIKDVTNDGTDN